MIFRRIKAHLEKENWFAVGIDFLIVVIGVFIGIQVANWNASQFERQEEAAIVERLQSDFERIEQDADRSLAFHSQMAEDMRTVLRSLRSGTLKDEDIPAFERALILGPAFQTSADRAGTFTELMSSGRGNILRDRDLLHTLVEYEDRDPRHPRDGLMPTKIWLLQPRVYGVPGGSWALQRTIFLTSQPERRPNKRPALALTNRPNISLSCSVGLCQPLSENGGQPIETTKKTCPQRAAKGCACHVKMVRPRRYGFRILKVTPY